MRTFRPTGLHKPLMAVAFMALACLMTATPPASAQDGDRVAEAREFIRDLQDQTLSQLVGEEVDEAEREAKFRDLLRENFDVRSIGAFALGRYWRVASEEQRTTYLDLFEDLIVDVYAYRFRNYDGERIEITDAYAEGRRDVTVRTELTGGGPPLQIDWRVRLNGEPKVVDIAVGGVSLSLTQRQEFASIIERNGGQIEALLDALRGGEIEGPTSAQAG